MKVQLNLATTRQENNRPFLATSTFLGVVGLIAFAFLSHAAYTSWMANRELHTDTARWESQIRADQAEQRELSDYFRSKGAVQILDRSAFLNSLIEGRSFPWTKIFMDLEQTLPPGVRVVSISPRLVNGRAEVSLEIGAQTDNSKIQFLEAIEHSKVFSGMVLKDEKAVEQPGSTDKILMNLTVWYSTT